MDSSQYFRSLNLYEVLANIVPGGVLLLIAVIIFEIESFLLVEAGTLLLAALFITALVLGHVIQAVASQLEGKPTLFGSVVRASKGEIPEEEVPIAITHVERSFWPLIKRKFRLPDDFDEYGVMFRLLLSYVETTPATRSLHFQAVHSFHRSMWAVWHLSIGIITIGAVAKLLSLGFVRSWNILAIAAIGSFVGIRIFDKRKEKFNKLFIQYAIIDFYSHQLGNKGSIERSAY